jgi:hypothetical protein
VRVIIFLRARCRADTLILDVWSAILPLGLLHVCPSLGWSRDGIACTCQKTLFLCYEKVGRIDERDQDECEKGIFEVADNGRNQKRSRCEQDTGGRTT